MNKKVEKPVKAKVSKGDPLRVYANHNDANVHVIAKSILQMDKANKNSNAEMKAEINEMAGLSNRLLNDYTNVSSRGITNEERVANVERSLLHCRVFTAAFIFISGIITAAITMKGEVMLCGLAGSLIYFKATE